MNMGETVVHRYTQIVDLPDIEEVEVRYRYKDGAGVCGLHHGDMLRAVKAFLIVNTSPEVIGAYIASGIPTDESFHGINPRAES